MRLPILYTISIHLNGRTKQAHNQVKTGYHGLFLICLNLEQKLLAISLLAVAIEHTYQNHVEPRLRKRYNNLKRVSILALKTTEEYSTYRGVHSDASEIENQTRYILAIRNKWFELRKDMITKHGMAGMELDSMQGFVTFKKGSDDEKIDRMYQHWGFIKVCIDAVLGGLSQNHL